MALKAVIFDLDDTLYPECDYVESGFRHVSMLVEELLGINGNESFEVLMDGFRKGVRHRNFNQLLDEMGVAYDDAFIGRLVKAYRGHDPEIYLPASSKEVIETLKREGILLGLLTDGYHEQQKNKVRQLSLEGLLDIIVYTDEWGRSFWKPNKFCFEYILDAAGLTGGECCYVGDNPEKDFKGARDCGMLTLQTIEWVERYREGVPDDFLPHQLINGLGDIMDFI